MSESTSPNATKPSGDPEPIIPCIPPPGIQERLEEEASSNPIAAGEPPSRKEDRDVDKPNKNDPFSDPGNICIQREVIEAGKQEQQL